MSLWTLTRAVTPRLIVRLFTSAREASQYCPVLPHCRFVKARDCTCVWDCIFLVDYGGSQRNEHRQIRAYHRHRQPYDECNEKYCSENAAADVHSDLRSSRYWSMSGSVCLDATARSRKAWTLNDTRVQWNQSLLVKHRVGAVRL
jgi:hypothetical protein